MHRQAMVGIRIRALLQPHRRLAYELRWHGNDSAKEEGAMVAPRQRLIVVVCLLAVLFMLPIAALADDYIQELKNKASFTTANDLTLYFLNDVTLPITGLSATDPVTDPDGKHPKEPDKKGKDGSYTFSKGKLPANVAPGSGLKLSFTGGKGAQVNTEKSYWTEDGKQILGALASLGQPADIFFAGGSAFAELSNPGPFALLYTDIHLYRDNDLANYGTPRSAYDITGTAVGGLPSMLTLAPGASTRLDFGAFDVHGYELIVRPGRPLLPCDRSGYSGGASVDADESGAAGAGGFRAAHVLPRLD
jgi:hypothetical protein